MKPATSKSELFATVFSFDGEVCAHFDISTYLMWADISDLVAMQDNDWSFCPAFQKAMEENAVRDPALAQALDYIESDSCEEGFDVNVEPAEAAQWLRSKRPEAFKKLKEIFGGAEYGGFDGDSWAVMDDYLYDQTKPRGETYYENPYSDHHRKIRIRWRVGVENIDAGSFLLEIKTKDAKWKPILLAEKVAACYNEEDGRVNIGAFSALKTNAAPGPGLEHGREFIEKLVKGTAPGEVENAFVLHAMNSPSSLIMDHDMVRRARSGIWLFVKRFLVFERTSLSVVATHEDGCCKQKELAWTLNMEEATLANSEGEGSFYFQVGVPDIKAA